MLPDAVDYFSYIADSRHRAQIGPAAWLPDYPAASSMLQLLRCDAFVPASPGQSNYSEFCDRRADELMRRASQMPADDAAADALWAAADKRVTDQAAVVPLINVQVDRLRLPAGRQLPVQPAVGRALRPAVGALSGRPQPADHVKRVRARGGASPPGRRPRRTSTTGAAARAGDLDAGGAQALAGEAVREPDDDQRGAVGGRDDAVRARVDEHRLGRDPEPALQREGGVAEQPAGVAAAACSDRCGYR